MSQIVLLQDERMKERRVKGIKGSIANVVCHGGKLCDKLGMFLTDLREMMDDLIFSVCPLRV